MAAAAHGKVGPWRREVNDLLRGMTGGFLIGTPLLYTMETWWIGETIPPLRALLFLAVAYVVNLGFVAWSGFRRQEEGWLERCADALEATALAVVAAGITLTLLHQIHLDQPISVIVGRLCVDAAPISLGIAIANHIMAVGETRLEAETDERSGKASHEPENGVRAALLDVGASFAGALFLCFSIAPTEEVPMLATEVPTIHLPLIIGFSLLLTYGIVFVAEFGGQERRATSPGLFQRPVTETVASYMV